MEDQREYACKFVNEKACLVALNDTAIKSDVVMRSIEIWTCEDKTEFQLKEILYSKRKAASLVSAPRELMHGPDMYHVYNKNNILQASIWQPMHLPNMVELVDLTVPGKQSTQLMLVTPDANQVLKKALMDIIIKRYGIVSVTSVKEKSFRIILS